MYTQHYNLAEPPFSIVPDPRYLYLTAHHREGLAHLLYGIGEGGGFVVLTGEVGTGKTTLSRCLLEQLPDDVDIALIFNPRLNSIELLAAICDELRIDYPVEGATLKQLIDALNRRLLDSHARGRRTIVLIDEAQNLSLEVLEQIRLLTNLETNRAKLVQIILMGQPELNLVLDSPELRQLAQRITARYHLRPLSRTETAGYIRHRLAVAGVRYPLFTGPALSLIHRISGGIPRRVNILCDRSLLGAYGSGRYRVDQATARRAALELRPPPAASNWPRRVAIAGAVVAVAGGGAFWLWSDKPLGPLAERTLRAEDPELGPGEMRTAGKGALVAPPASGGGAPPSPLDFGQRLAEQGSAREVVWAKLFETWNLRPPAVGHDPCSAAEVQGLRCLTTRGTWLQLRGLNLPAVLEFVLPNGEKRRATLLRLRGNQAELALADGPGVFDLAEFLPYWRGDAVLLWKPPGGVTALVEGTVSEAVVWVRQRLPAPAAPEALQFFDKELRENVLAFQKQHGLSADGVVGAQTMILLSMRAEDPGIPRLISINP